MLFKQLFYLMRFTLSSYRLFSFTCYSYLIHFLNNAVLEAGPISELDLLEDVLIGNESRSVLYCSDSDKSHAITASYLWKSIDFIHVKGLDFQQRKSFHSLLSFPGNRKQSVFTLMMYIRSMQSLHTSFSFSAQLHHIPFILMHSHGGYVSVSGSSWNNRDLKKENAANVIFIQPPFIQPHPVS